MDTDLARAATRAANAACGCPERGPLQQTWLRSWASDSLPQAVRGEIAAVTRPWQGSFVLCAAPIAGKRLMGTVRVGGAANLGRCIHLADENAPQQCRSDGTAEG
jgi:hypothetical protein